MRASITDLWTEVLSRIQKELGSARFNLWFANTQLESVGDDRVEIGTPNLFVASWLEEHYRDLVARELRRCLQRDVEVRFTAAARLFQEARTHQEEELARLVGEASAQTNLSATERALDAPKVRRDFRFDTFVVGPCNRLAYTCALEVAGNREPRFNPLFLHSDCGLGKTHLLQAIWHAVNEAGDRRAEYLAAETFTNEFTYALRHNRLDAFRHKYRRADVLLIDDVHFFSNKAGLQGELLHTFDALETAHKLIVLASDAHPNHMSSLHKGLASRFVSGMVVRLEKPSYEVRLQIVRTMVARLHKAVDEEVLKYIAERHHENVRALQGAVHTLLAYAALSGGRVDLALAREVFQSRTGLPAPPRTMATVEQVVCEEFGISPAELHSRKRTRAVSLPRQVCLYLGRRLSGLTCAEIARHFGHRHHTAVLFAEKSVRERAAREAEFAARLRALEQRLGQAPTEETAGNTQP